MSWGYGEGEHGTYLACGPWKDCQVSCPYASPVPWVLFTSGGILGVKPVGQTKPPASEEQELLFSSKANCLMSKVFFLSFFLCLSNVWNFDDGNVILRAIFKILRNWLRVLRMNSLSIKFTFNVSSKNLNHSLHCKPHGIT